MVLQAILILSVSVSVAIGTYYGLLGLCAVLNRRATTQFDASAAHRFAIVIPAYNEEASLPKVLRSCQDLDFPPDKYDVIVIADNCTDNTKAVAVAHLALCLERCDAQNTGKGHALGWAFQRILPIGYDAIVVLDADCTIDSHALRVLDRLFHGGSRALQVDNVVSNPNESVVTYVAAVGNLIENQLFYKPKSMLGLAVFLRGTGMAFHASVLEMIPWRAHSVSEDVEYTLDLLRRDIRIEFVSQARVMSESPVDRRQLDVQRTRWAGGTLTLGRTQALKLVAEGVLKRKGKLVDAGWTFLVLSRPLVLIQLLVTLVLAWVSLWLSPGRFSSAMLLVSITVLAVQTSYLAAGVLSLGVDRKRIRLLLKAPRVIAEMTILSVRGLLGFGKDVWARTPRR